MDEHPGMDLRPPTERVSAGRRAPLFVALAVAGALVVFVARPWDGPRPQPSPVALATATTAPSPSTETPAPSATPTAPPPVLPTPDFGPQTPVGTVSLNDDAGTPNVRCGYGRARNGARRLVSLEVQPPIVMLGETASAIDISRVGWSFQAEANVQQGVFDRAWQVMGASRMQAVGTADGTRAPFTPLGMAIRADDVTHTAVFRVRLVVEWFTRNLERAGRTEVVVGSYQDARLHTSGAPFWPYCAGVLRIN